MSFLGPIDNDSTTGNGTVPTIPPHHQSFPLAVTVVFAVIVGIGFLGNLFIIVIVYTIKKLRNAQNIFVTNLCIADLLLATNTTFAIVEELVPGWRLQVGACRLFGFMSVAPPLAAVLSMVIIARNRYKVITGNSIVNIPGKFSVKRVAVSLVIVWGVTLLISLPILIGLVTAKPGLFCACCFYFSDNLIYGIIVSVALFFIPNVIIAYCYIKIIVHVRASRKRVGFKIVREKLFKSTFSVRNVVGKTRRRHDIKLTVQFITLFLAFNICYLPAMLVFWTAEDMQLLPLPGLVAVHAIFILNIVANPLIYFVFNKSALQVVRKTMCKNRVAPGDEREMNGSHLPTASEFPSTNFDSPSTISQRVQDIVSPKLANGLTKANE